MEINERLEDTAVRELYEETRLKAVSLKLYGIFSGPEFHYVYPNGDEVSIIDTVFLCSNFTGVLKPQRDEVTELKWLKFDEMPEAIAPTVKIPLQRFTQDYIKGCIK